MRRAEIMLAQWQVDNSDIPLQQKITSCALLPVNVLYLAVAYYTTP